MEMKKTGTTAEAIARHFGMAPHPEGGFYVETYRSEGVIPAEALPKGWGGHCWSTGILFLLREGEISHLHRIRQDEMWHFYLGGPLRLVMITPQGEGREVVLGQDVLAGQHVQYTVPAGCWFGARPCEGTAFSLVGCTVAPGFAFADFELARGDALRGLFPRACRLIDEFAL